MSWCSPVYYPYTFSKREEGCECVERKVLQFSASGQNFSWKSVCVYAALGVDEREEEYQVKGVKLIKDFASKPHRELIRLSGNLEMEARNWKLAGGKIRGGFLLRVTDRRRWRYHFHNQQGQGVWITALGPSAWLFLVLLSVWIFMWLWKLAWNETANRVPTKVVRQRRNQSTSRVWTHDCLLLSCMFLMFANVFFCLVTPETKLKSSPGSSLQVACVLGI